MSVELVVPLVARALVADSTAAPLLLVGCGAACRSRARTTPVQPSSEEPQSHHSAPRSARVFPCASPPAPQSCPGSSGPRQSRSVRKYSITDGCDRNTFTILHALHKHVTLRKLIVRAGRFFPSQSKAHSPPRRWAAAQSTSCPHPVPCSAAAQPVVRAQHILLGQVAMEVQAGQVQLLRLRTSFSAAPASATSH